MIGRGYIISTSGILVAAAQDLAQIKGATGKMLLIRRVSLGATDTSLPTAQMLQLRARLLPATVTDGTTGGTSPTPQPIDTGDAAASFTAKANMTTPATTSGTASVKMEKGVHVYAGLDFVFLKPVPVGPSESFVFELLAAPTGTLHLSMEVEVDEIGG